MYMKNLKQNIGIILIFMTIAAIIIFLPYKEILKCNEENCSIGQCYILKNKNNSYIFNRNDELLPVYHSSGGKLGSTRIINLSNNKYIFENDFLSHQGAENIINVIKNRTSDIKITKYWFGYKIEK